MKQISIFVKKKTCKTINSLITESTINGYVIKR